MRGWPKKDLRAGVAAEVLGLELTIACSHRNMCALKG